MAFHGGLEMGTAEIATEAAALSNASLYVVRQPADLRWHVPSHQVDPSHSDLLAGWLRHVEVVVALHGYGRVGRPRRILAGGRNRRAAEVVGRRLTAALAGFTEGPWFPLEVVTDVEDMPAELRGMHPDNPVNRPRLAGVQLEMSPSARHGVAVPAIVQALAESVPDLEAVVSTSG
jgi:phage replication-related protein YjqB (UPF0714/DUF867 family)